MTNSERRHYGRVAARVRPLLTTLESLEKGGSGSPAEIQRQRDSLLTGFRSLIIDMGLLGSDPVPAENHQS